MKRRHFIAEAAVAATAGTVLSRLGRAHASTEAKAPAADALQRIAVTTWSLHAFFPQTKEKELSGEPIDLRRFPELVADRYHVHNLELCSVHFESTGAAYLRELKDSLARAHARVVNMPVDYEHDWDGRGLCDADEKQWRSEIAERKKWIDIAAELGSQAIRPNPGGTAKTTDLSRPIAAYKELGEYGRAKGVRVLIENHGNVAGKAANIVAIIKGAGPGPVGSLPDFGNFAQAERFAGLEQLFPFASVVCHARYETPGGAEMNGKLVTFDLARCMQIARAAGFKGVYSAEFAGAGDPYQGTGKIIDAVVKQLRPTE
ncbi:MAG TPA: TIM barrel protein [Vicinamibacteria bacterium]|nr:TIM barrel protein [Vicinamibacteria bacterium]